MADALGILDALEIERAHVVGHDWGAAVAWLLSAEAPERVASLTALSVPHLSALSWAMANDPDQQQRSQYIQLLRTEGVAEDTLLADDAARLCAMYAPLPTTTSAPYVELLTDRAVGRAGALRCGEHVTGEYRFVELEGVSHWIPEQAPDTVARAVLDHAR